MKTRTLNIETGRRMARSVLECGGKRSATPLLDATGTVEKRRRRIALLAQSKTWRIFGALLTFLALTISIRAQTYSIDWYKIAGGGGTSTGATFQVSGTIGQPDASVAMSGGSYSLTGGFWSLIAVVQTAGLPNLTISHSGNSVIISWPNTGSYTLQQNANLALANGWTTSGYSISTSNGTNSITITSPTGGLFFRLRNP